MDYKNTRQFLPGYHSITGYETVRIRGGHDRYCQARDVATDMGRKVFHLGVTKRQLDRWKLSLREGMTIQDYSGSYRVEEISFADGKPVCTCTPIEEPGLDDSDLIFGVLHQADQDELESDEVEISGIMKSSGRTASRHFRCISFTLPESSGFHKAFMVLTPNSEIVRSNFLIGESSKVDEHGDQYQVEKIDYAIRPTYPFLLTTKLPTPQQTTNLQNNQSTSYSIKNQSTGKVDNKRRLEEEAAS